MSGQERYDVAFRPGSAVNWSYKTTPQYENEVDYSRGKGLGGSTAINFCGWLVGPSGDWEEWARVVRDEDFGWERVKRWLGSVEALRDDVPEGFKGVIRPSGEGEPFAS
jgi:choline dehydrogenase-like flavoprotein